MTLRYCVGTALLLAAFVVACGPTAEPAIVSGSGDTAPADSSSASSGGQDVSVPDEGREHVAEGTEITYQHYPPASGPHYAVTLQYGLYEQDVPEGYWVHSLEHGAIVVLYKCAQPCPDLVQSLGDMLDTFPLTKWDNRKIVIVPYSRMDVPLMAVAWNVQMSLDQFDAQALIDFYSRHVDQGPEDVP